MSMNIQEQVGDHLETGDRGEQVVFTYDELQRLCLLAAQSSK